MDRGCDLLHRDRRYRGGFDRNGILSLTDHNVRLRTFHGSRCSHLFNLGDEADGLITLSGIGEVLRASFRFSQRARRVIGAIGRPG